MPKWWIAVMCFWILNQPVHRINCPCMKYVYLPETQITNGLLKGQFPFYRIAGHNKGVSLSHRQLHWIIHAFANNNAACMWNKYNKWLARNWQSLTMTKLERSMNNSQIYANKLTKVKLACRLWAMTLHTVCTPLVQNVRYAWMISQ